MYTLYKRVALYPQMQTFDAPDRQQSCTRRDRSISPLQALNLLNDPVSLDAAQGLAARVLRERNGGRRDRIEYAFRLCLARRPSAAELDRLERYYDEQAAIFKSEPGSRAPLFPALGLEGVADTQPDVWVAIASLLLNLDEFITRE